MKFKRTASIILLILFTAIFFASCNKEKKDNADEIEGQAAENADNAEIPSTEIKPDKTLNTLKIDTYTESSSPVGYSIADKNTVGILFSTKRPFDGIEIYCSTGGNEKQTVSLSLYKFNTDPATTVKSGKPLITQTYENISDNSWLMLKFKDKPAGSYLLVAHNGTKNINLLSDSAAPAFENKIIGFYNNIKIETGAIRFRVLFNEKNNNENIDVDQYFDSPDNSSKTAKN
jgi:hypothetical protein